MGLIKATPPEAPQEGRVAGAGVEELLCGLVADNPDARRRAALELVGEAAAATALAAAAGTETDRAARDAMLAALTGIGGVRAARLVAGHIRADDAALRNGAAEALAEMPAAVEVIDDLLADQDADIRILAVMVVAMMPDPHAALRLASLVAADADPRVVGSAVGELARIGDSSVVATLRAARSRFPGDPFVGFAVELAESRLVPGE